MRVGRMLQEWGISRPRRRTPVGPPLVGSMLTQWSRIRLRRCFGRDRERPMAVTKNPGLLLVRQAGAASFSFFSSAARERKLATGWGLGNPSHYGQRCQTSDVPGFESRPFSTCNGR
jgi:hypothetical protein